MNKDMLKIGLGLMTTAGVILVGHDALSMSQGEFDQKIPTVINAHDSRGKLYEKVSKDISTKGLNQEETYFIHSVLNGKGITAEGTASVKEVESLYYQTALKMGLTAQDIASGVNLYEFIRK